MDNIFTGEPLKSFQVKQVQFCKDKIVYFGDDNLLPQQMNDIFSGSQTFQSCLQKYENAILGDVEAPAWLFCAIQDYYKFGGFYLLIARNLEGQITDIKPLNFESVRLSEPDDLGKTFSVIVGDWAMRVRNKKKFRAIKYPLYEVPLDTIYKEYGHTISVYHYFNPSFTFYPQSRFSAVVKDIVNEGLLQDDRYFNLVNGSSEKVVFRTTLPQDDIEKAQKIQKIQDWISPSGSRLIVCDSQFGSTGDTLVDDFRVDTIPSSRDFIDETFEGRVSANICKAGGIPQALVGNVSANMFSGQLIKESQQMLVFDTKKDRAMFNRLVVKLGADIELREPEIMQI